MNVYLGFDPGGEIKQSFGWAVCSAANGVLHVGTTGRASYAEEAIIKALSAIPKTGTVVGAGIDAPLFWTESGRPREVDYLVREATRELGCPTTGGTVQSFNSLRGACLVQGVLTANHLHKHFPDICITESHPKALLYLLGIANKSKSPSSVSLAHLKDFIRTADADITEDERDAVLGALSAFHQKKSKAWIDLFKEELEPITPFGYKVGYWMPWELIS